MVNKDKYILFACVCVHCDPTISRGIKI